MPNVVVNQKELEEKFRKFVHDFNGNSSKNTEKLEQMVNILSSDCTLLLEDLASTKDKNLIVIARRAISYLQKVKTAKVIKEKVERHNELDTAKPIQEYTSILDFFAYVYYMEILYKKRIEKKFEQFKNIDSYLDYMRSIGAKPNTTAYADAKMDFAQYDSLISNTLVENMYSFIAEIEGLGGEILDTKYLAISEKGNLDGYVICTDKNIAINTFGAGGHNIQRFHYRTNIRVKSK